MHDCGIFPHLLSNYDIEKRIIFLYETSQFRFVNYRIDLF